MRSTGRPSCSEAGSSAWASRRSTSSDTPTAAAFAQFLLLSHRPRVRRIALIASGGLGREVSLELRLASLPRLVEELGQPFLGTATSLALRLVGAVMDREDAEWMSEVYATPGFGPGARARGARCDRLARPALAA